MIVCLFPAEKWVRSKKFSAKNGIFWSKWPKFNWNYKVKKWISLSSWTILSISGGQKKQFFAVLGHILYIGGNFMCFATLAGKQLFEPQQALWSKKALVFSWEIDKLKFFYEKWQLWKILKYLHTSNPVIVPKLLKEWNFQVNLSNFVSTNRVYFMRLRNMKIRTKSMDKLLNLTSSLVLRLLHYLVCRKAFESFKIFIFHKKPELCLFTSI